jgi:hypothetical protein
MKEFIELRLEEKQARKIFLPHEGRRIGDDKDTRVVRITRDDPRFERISQLEKKWNDAGRAFSFGAGVARTYTAADLKAAELFDAFFYGRFDPPGEECGTEYDETKACPVCGAGAPLVGPLRAARKALGRNMDFASSYAGETAISARAAEVFRKEKIMGPVLKPLFHGQKATEPSTDWFQLDVSHADADIVPPTWISSLPYDWDKNEYGCLRGDTLGLRHHSEFTIRMNTNSKFDLFQTRQFLGRRAGMLRPERRFLASPRFRDAVLSYGLKGCRFEVAHFA